MIVKSPLTNSENVEFIKSIKVSEILENYRILYPEIDPSYIFKGIKTVEVYQCKDTKYTFYWPLDLCGDKDYYDKLSKLDWYYSPWKWEHIAAAEHIKNGDKVLEVGAAKGDFIKRIKEEKNAEVVGLELNPNVEEYSKLNNVTLLNESVQSFSESHLNEFDVVCSFQVLEHVSEVKSFIQSMIDTLKPGGYLIIGVPNNDTFIAENRLSSRVMNMPPHHLGLWTEESLHNLQNIFDIKYLGKDLEPLQPPFYETYLMHRFYQIFKSDFIVKVLWKIGITKLFKPLVLRNKQNVIGHSINVYFTKN
jgi:2-polyprenyl-3-methyl-5-hydroxy-6-metoxy-1,4-benzoquinol methylase